MKIGILSRNENLYSTRRLIEACEQRGHEYKIIDALRCYMNINSTQPSVHQNGEDLVGFDAIIPRIGSSVTFYAVLCFANLKCLAFTPSMIQSQFSVRVTNCVHCNYCLVRILVCRSQALRANRAILKTY
nr:hypothetical protein [Enterovibrio nigricans]